MARTKGAVEKYAPVRAAKGSGFVADAARRSVVIGALGAAALLGRALPAEAAVLPQHPCTPQLEKLLAAWNAAGFKMPSKPGQMIVHGRNRRVSSGPEVTYMISQIRQAV
jgi:hypothetical protein